MKAQEKVCKNCKFFDPYNTGTGLCRRYAPRAGDDRWPELYEDNWCGEFVAKTEGERTYE